jgi:hypothetical protein
MSSLVNAFNIMSGAFKAQWNSTSQKTQPLGKQIYQRPHPLSKEEKCFLLFLKAEGVDSPDSFVDKAPRIRGFHGTSLEALSNQLQNGKFDNQNRRIYFASVDTAVDYAHFKESCGEHGIIVELSSDCHSQLNDFINEDLGFYCFIPPGKDQEVFIERAWEVRSLPLGYSPFNLALSKAAYLPQHKRLWLSVRAAFDAVASPQQAQTKTEQSS